MPQSLEFLNLILWKSHKSCWNLPWCSQLILISSTGLFLFWSSHCVLGSDMYCIRRSHPTWLERQCKPVQSRAKMQLFSVTVLCSINKSFCRRILLGWRSRNLRLETLKLEAGSWKLETQNSKLEARNSKLETRNSSLETRASRNRKLRGSSFEFRVETVNLPLTGTVLTL